MQDLGRLGLGVNTIVNKLAALSSFAIYGMRARNPRTGRPWFATNPTKAFKWPQTRRANIPIIVPDEIHAFLSVPLNGGKAMIRDLLFDTGLRARVLDPRHQRPRRARPPRATPAAARLPGRPGLTIPRSVLIRADEVFQ
jgi:hypothetical protein